MKKIVIPVLMLILCVTGGAAGEEPSPSAFLPEQVYTFEPVIEGAEVSHDFILQNKGNETLLIEKLSSG
jgi:hypothetical protein